MRSLHPGKGYSIQIAKRHIIPFSISLSKNWMNKMGAGKIFAGNTKRPRVRHETAPFMLLCSISFILLFFFGFCFSCAPILIHRNKSIFIKLNMCTFIRTQNKHILANLILSLGDKKWYKRKHLYVTMKNFMMSRVIYHSRCALISYPHTHTHPRAESKHSQITYYKYKCYALHTTQTDIYRIYIFGEKTNGCNKICSGIFISGSMMSIMMMICERVCVCFSPHLWMGFHINMVDILLDAISLYLIGFMPFIHFPSTFCRIAKITGKHRIYLSSYNIYQRMPPLKQTKN